MSSSLLQRDLAEQFRDGLGLAVAEPVPGHVERAAAPVLMAGDGGARRVGAAGEW
jgi:hypothetical protein